MSEEDKDDNDIDYNALVNEVADSYIDKRRIYLENTDDNANYYYRRLQLSIGKLKVPRVRYSNTFRPSLLPKPWRRVDKDYENILLALLANGYSKVEI